MSYLRRLVAKMQATTPRLVPRRSPSFGGAPGLEERDEDVVVSTRTLDAPKSEPRAAASAPAVSPIDATSAAPAPETRSDRGSAAGVTAPVVAGAPDEQAPPSSPPRRRARRPAAAAPPARVRPAKMRATATPPRRDDDAPLIAPAAQHEARAAQRPRPPIAEPLRRQPGARERANAAPDSTTVVNIAIGRIEVRAAAAPAKPSREQPFRPRLSLEAHLAGASGDRR